MFKGAKLGWDSVRIGEVLDIGLDVLLRELAADKALDVEDGAVRVGGGLVLGGVSDQALFVGKGDVRGSNTVSWSLAVSGTVDDVAEEQRGVAGVPWSLTRISTLPFCITPTHLNS